MKTRRSDGKRAARNVSAITFAMTIFPPLTHRWFHCLIVLSLLAGPACRAAGVQEPSSAPAVVPAYTLGVSYYPEWWDEARWGQDFAGMAAMGFNTVRMGEFAWAVFEPRPGEYHFEWMDRAIAAAARHGLHVILGTPTASIPPWLRQLHPDTLGGNERGGYTYGGRKGPALHSPAMREAAERLVTAMARHFADQPAVVGWQIDNEPGFPFVDFSESALKAFRAWLQQRYGTLDALNRAWGGGFWSNRYTAWEQIEFPINSAEGGWRPASWLDYRRFFSASFIDWLRVQEAWMRPQLRGRYVFANWPDTRWSVDVFAAAKVIDVTAWDNYCPMPAGEAQAEQFYASMNHDLCRATRPDQRFFIAEQASQAPVYSDPRAVRFQTYSDLAHGSTGTLFYEWRPPVAGNEQGYESVLLMDGTPGPSANVLRRLASELQVLAPRLQAARTRAEVAMVFSYENLWDQGFWKNNTFRNLTTGYDALFQRYYNGFKQLGTNLDVIAPGMDLSPYRVVVAPGLRIVDDPTAEALLRFVHDGGCLILDARAGTREPSGGMREQVGPGPFRAAAGFRVISRGLPSRMPGRAAVRMGDESFPADEYLEGLEIGTARTIASFEGPGMTGKPAVSCCDYGKGQLVYVAFESQASGFFATLARKVAAMRGVEPLLTGEAGLEIVSRCTHESEFVFVLNPTASAKQAKLTGPMVDALTGTAVADAVDVAGFDVRILERPQSAAP